MLPTVLPQSSDQSDKLYGLTEMDRRYVNFLIQYVQRVYGSREGFTHETPANYAPEVLIVQFPTAGIPERVGNTPGRAECDVYTIIPTDPLNPDTSDPTLTQVLLPPSDDPYKIWVYNIYPVKVYGAASLTRYMTVRREQITGRWLCEKPSYRLKVKPTANVIANNGSPVDAAVWIHGADSGDTVETYNNWAHGGQRISMDKEAWVEFRDDEAKFVYTGAECET